VDAALHWAAPQIVFHLAAQPLVLRSFEEPTETFDTNVMGTVHVLEAIRRTPSVSAAVIVTTDKVYESAPGARPHTEADRLGGHDPYSASKACAELVVECWRRSFPGVAVATARAGNVIGGGDWSQDRIVPDMVRAVAAGVAPRLRNPDAVRPWQHVLEPLAGYLWLGRQLLDGDASAAAGWNFGPDPSTLRTVRALADELMHRLAVHGVLPVAAPAAGGATGAGHPERAHLALDSSKADAELGWRPILSFAEAVDLTAAFYAEGLRNPALAAGEAMVRQIGAYQDLAAERSASWAAVPVRVATDVG